MESAKHVALKDQPSDEETSGKAIRISLEHHAMLKEGRDQINSDPFYKKKISFSRYVEKLIEEFWKRPIEELKKEREGARESLQKEHKREAPHMDFFEWVILNHKKSPRRTKGGER